MVRYELAVVTMCSYLWLLLQHFEMHFETLQPKAKCYEFYVGHDRYTFYQMAGSQQQPGRLYVRIRAWTATYP